jgi:hypothetical protein
VGEIWDKVKIVHSSDLKGWTRFPEYRCHEGPTLGEYHARHRADEAVLLEFHGLVDVQEKLAELDVVRRPKNFGPFQLNRDSGNGCQTRRLHRPSQIFRDRD